MATSCHSIISTSSWMRFNRRLSAVGNGKFPRVVHRDLFAFEFVLVIIAKRRNSGLLRRWGSALVGCTICSGQGCTLGGAGRRVGGDHQRNQLNRFRVGYQWRTRLAARRPSAAGAGFRRVAVVAGGCGQRGSRCCNGRRAGGCRAGSRSRRGRCGCGGFLSRFGHCPCFNALDSFQGFAGCPGGHRHCFSQPRRAGAFEPRGRHSAEGFRTRQCRFGPGGGAVRDRQRHENHFGCEQLG